MANETISVIWAPIANTGAMHGTLVYTSANGQMYYTGGTFSNYTTLSAAQKEDPANFGLAELAARFGLGTSVYGRLITISGVVSDTDLGVQTYGRTWFSSGYQASILATGSNLSTQWSTITSTMSQINNANLTYGPLSQNSNSAWCTAAAAAGIDVNPILNQPLPLPGSGVTFAPGCGNLLPVPATSSIPAEIKTGSISVTSDNDLSGAPTVTVIEQGSSGEVRSTVIVGMDSSTGTDYQIVQVPDITGLTAEIRGIGAVFSGSSTRVFLDSASSATLSGIGNAIYVQSSSAATILGSMNSISVFGTNSIVNDYGNHDVLASVGDHVSLNAYGNNALLSASGAFNALNLIGDHNTANAWGINNGELISSTGAYNNLNAYGRGIVENADGLSNRLNLIGDNNIANAFGQSNDEKISSSGANNSLNAYGDGIVEDASGYRNFLNLIGDHNTANAWGDNNLQQISSIGDWNNLNAWGNGIIENADGAHNALNLMGTNNTANAWGDNNFEVIASTGADNHLSAYGDGVTSYAAGSANFVNNFGLSDTSYSFGVGVTTYNYSATDQTFATDPSDFTISNFAAPSPALPLFIPEDLHFFDPIPSLPIEIGAIYYDPTPIHLDPLFTVPIYQDLTPTINPAWIPDFTPSLIYDTLTPSWSLPDELCIDDPVVLNLAGGKVETQGVHESKARFDMTCDGRLTQTGWVTAGEGLLVYSKDEADAPVHRADQLVAGMAALRQYDDNHDNLIDRRDTAWQAFRVWVDAYGTGEFETTQLHRLDELGITDIQLNAASVNRNNNGNIIYDESTFTWANGEVGQVAGVGFQYIAPKSPAVDQAVSHLISAMAAFSGPTTCTGPEPSLQGTGNTALWPTALLAAPLPA